MTEIFLAYDSSDRERVRPVRDTLTAQGFDVHWDLEPPAGAEWEKWVLWRLVRCKCVVVLRSAASAHSNRMSHVEAVAKEHGKLIVVRLEPRSLAQSQAGAGIDGLNLAGWRGDLDHAGWQELSRRIEAKLKVSLWVQRLTHDVEMERTRWRAQYETSAARCKSLNDELAQERSERCAAHDKVAGLQAQLDADAKARFRFEARIVELEQRLARAEEKHAEASQLLREEVRQKDARLTEAEAALGQAQDEAVRLRTELAAVEGVHGELKSCIASHESTIRVRDSHIVDLDARIVQRDADIAGLQAAVARLKAAVAERDANIAGIKAIVVERNGDLAGLRATVAERDGSVVRLKANVTERDGAVAGLKAGVVARDADIAGLKADVAERDSYIAELAASVTQRDTYIVDLRSTLAERSGYMADLEASIAQRDTHIADLKSTLAERDTHIVGLQASVTKLEQRPRGLAAVPLPAALSRMTRRRWGNAGLTP